MNKYTVRMIVQGSYATREFEADYFVVQDGALALRRSRKPNEYPETVIVIADGHWCSIEKVVDVHNAG